MKTSLILQHFLFNNVDYYKKYVWGVKEQNFKTIMTHYKYNKIKQYTYSKLLHQATPLFTYKNIPINTQIKLIDILVKQARTNLEQKARTINTHTVIHQVDTIMQKIVNKHLHGNTIDWLAVKNDILNLNNKK